MQLTMKTYQAQLPLRNAIPGRIITPVPMPSKPTPPMFEGNMSELKEKMKQRFLRALFGGWHCHDCNAFCDRIEGEQGQPARCATCGSPRIRFIPPVHQQQEAI